MSEYRSYIKIQRSSERNFGLVFSIFFMIICIYPILYNENIRVWALFISIILFFFSFFLPQALIIPNKLWFKLGVVLGAIVAPIIMALVYFLTVVPTGIIMRLFGKNLLQQKFDKSKNSYWIKRKESISSLENQF